MTVPPRDGEAARLDDELSRAMSGEAWHGPDLAGILADVTVAEAAARPVAGAHTIWELALHLVTWARVPRQRIATGNAVKAADKDNFPAPPPPSEDAWRQAVSDLERETAALRDVVRALSDAELRRASPGAPHDLSVMIHGVAQHMAYHGGQMVILKKALRARSR
jgi:uncharacterized damage-inducible protein DinB